MTPRAHPPTHAPNNEAYRCHCCTLNIAGRGGITPKRLHDREGVEENTCAYTHTRARTHSERRAIRPPFIQAADPLRRRGRVGGRLHRDHLPRPCDGGGCCRCGAMLPEEASRSSGGSLMNVRCFLLLLLLVLLLLLPAPLLRAASHHYRLPVLLPPLPSSWHADDLCQAALMTFCFVGQLEVSLTTAWHTTELQRFKT